MADSFGLKIGLEGEKEFKKALADINQSFKVLGSETIYPMVAHFSTAAFPI